MEIGRKGSTIHILTNKNIQNKKECLEEKFKQEYKANAPLTGIVAGSAATAGLATGCSKTVQANIADLKKIAAEKLDKIIIKQGKKVPSGEHVDILYDISLKDKIKETKLFKKFNNLAPAAQAAIAAGTLALAIAFPIISHIKAAETGHVEGLYETV